MGSFTTIRALSSELEYRTENKIWDYGGGGDDYVIFLLTLWVVTLPCLNLLCQNITRDHITSVKEL